MSLVPELPHKVFTYGTLKRGTSNHKELMDEDHGKAQFLSLGHTKKKYPLVTATKYHVPLLLDAPGQGKLVKGEIYAVDDQMLEFLDFFEGVPTLYYRTKIEIQDTTTPSVVECWGYMHQPEGLMHLPAQDQLPQYDAGLVAIHDGLREEANTLGISPLDLIQKALEAYSSTNT